MDEDAGLRKCFYNLKEKERCTYIDRPALSS